MNLDISNLPVETQTFLQNAVGSKTGLIGGVPTLKGHIQQLIIPLDTALPNANNTGQYELPGHRFWVDTKTSGIASVFFDDPNAQIAGIPCIPGTVLKMPVNTVYIVAPAQPGLSLVINFGDFDVIPPFQASPAAVGLSYGASYKSTSNLGANTADNIVSNTANINGVLIEYAQYSAVGATSGTIALLSKAGAVAPATVIDGDPFLISFQNTAALAFAMPRLAIGIRVALGRRIDRLTTVAETSSFSSVLYTILQ